MRQHGDVLRDKTSPSTIKNRNLSSYFLQCMRLYQKILYLAVYEKIFFFISIHAHKSFSIKFANSSRLTENYVTRIFGSLHRFFF